MHLSDPTIIGLTFRSIGALVEDGDAPTGAAAAAAAAAVVVVVVVVVPFGPVSVVVVVMVGMAKARVMLRGIK